MITVDSVGRWIARRTGRTLDQPATDPIPAAADLPRPPTRCAAPGSSCCSPSTGCGPC